MEKSAHTGILRTYAGKCQKDEIDGDWTYFPDLRFFSWKLTRGGLESGSSSGILNKSCYIGSAEFFFSLG
jgi:hypothetical protein